MHVPWFLKRRGLDSAFTALQLEPVLRASIKQHHKIKRIPPLPDEIVLQILHIIAEETREGLPSYEWWDVPLDYAAFFKSARLVCHRWNSLVTSTYSPTLSIPARQYFDSRSWKIAPARLGECKNLHLVAFDGRRPPLPAVAPDLALRHAHSGKITSLSFDIALLLKDGLLPALEAAACQARRLRLYGGWPPLTLDWHSDASFVYGNSNLKELALTNVIVDTESNASVKPCKCTTVILQDAIFGPVESAEMFPNVRRFVLQQSVVADMTGPDHLSFTKPSSTLQHLEISWTALCFPLRHLPPESPISILTSPELRTFKLHAFGNCTDEAPAGQSCPFSISGHHMPTLQLISMHLSICGDWPSSFVTLCSQLQDPTFCPGLTDLPDLRIQTEDSDTYNRARLPDLWRDEACAIIKAGLEALADRGIPVPNTQRCGTIWDVTRSAS